jgi:phosphate transport system substrate-binding protein
LNTKKTILISVLAVASLATVLVIYLFAISPFFQPRSDFPSEVEVSEDLRTTSNDSIRNQIAPTTTMTQTPIIDVASIASAFPFVQRWAAQYENQELGPSGDVNVEYLSDREIIVSEEAIRLRNDLAIVGAIAESNNNTLYIPVSAQALAIVYNIPGFPDISSGLRLNSTTLFHMMNGSIIQWNDPAIRELNPGLNLPNERIIVVHTDYYNVGSNTSSLVLLNQYLGLQSLSWSKNGTIATPGPAELAEIVRRTPYSIGYVDFSYAVQTRMTFAAVANAEGDYILPSVQSIGHAVNFGLQFQNSSEEGLSFLEQHEHQQQQLPLPPTIDASRTVNGSYPLVGLYYASLWQDYPNVEDEVGRSINAGALDFVEWIISEGGGQQTLLEVHYPPIYSLNEELRTYSRITIDAIIQVSN